MSNSETISNNAVIEINNLKKSFGNQEILKSVSLQLFTGENLAILGKSGCGKSVLIKCIVRLLQPDSGTITVLGKNVNDLNNEGLAKMRRNVGFLFQSGALYDSMTVKQNLEFPLRRIKKGISQKDFDDKIQEVLEHVGLPEAKDKMPSQLSGGMRKRISLARTIVVDPKIMLYDEPTTGLDPVTSDEISLLVNDVQKKYKTSSIIITHDIACMRAVADRVVMLLEGEVYLTGTVEEFEKSTDPSIKAFFK